MEEEVQQLFVSDPNLVKDGMTQFTSYKLQGAKIPEPINRRYRDFDALRKKFVERWPGVYIPNIPHKKKIKVIIVLLISNYSLEGKQS